MTKPRKPPPGAGISRRSQEKIYIQSNRAYARLKLLRRSGRSKVEIIEEALDGLAAAEGIETLTTAPTS
jgi:hypothetical protein